MKKLWQGSLLLLALAIIIFASRVEASDKKTAGEFTRVKVEKGTTLWYISKVSYGSGAYWEVIQKRNNISDPKKLLVGMILIVPLEVPAKAASENLKKPCNEKVLGPKSSNRDNPLKYDRAHVGRDKYTGSPALAVRLIFGTSKFTNFEMESLYKDPNDIRGWESLKKGDLFLMTSGKDKVEFYTADLEEGDYIALKKFKAIADGKEYQISLNIWCGNFVLILREPIPEPKIPEPPQEINLLDNATEIPLVGCEIKFDPWDAGIGAGLFGRRELFRSKYWWAEQITFFDTSCFDIWDTKFGIGPFASGSIGHVKHSTYDWKEYQLGLQIGAKRSRSFLDGDNNTRWDFWQLKFRLVKERTTGENDEGYKMTQENFPKGGIYGEYVRQLSDRLVAGIRLEAWYAFKSKIHSTWEGDHAASRTYVNGGPYIQYRISQDWQVRAWLEGFYQHWDRLSGLNLGAQLRWKEMINIGPWIGIPLDKSHTYGHHSFSDLFLTGVGLEFRVGELSRRLYSGYKADGIRQLDDERFGIIEQ